MPGEIRRRILPAAMLGVAVMAILTGCTVPAASGADGSDATAIPTGTARPAVAAGESGAPELEWHHVVGSGDLVTADGAVLGLIEVIVGKHGLFDARLTGWDGDLPAKTGLTLHPEPVAIDSCTDTGFALSLGDLSLQPTQYFTIGTIGSGDPSFLETAVLSTLPDPAAGMATDCMRPAAAVAVLHWSIPDMRPGLHVIDSGRATAAIGDVTIVDGEPASYLVHGDDTLGAIAERFGITTSDLLYLNPTRVTPGSTGQAYAGETLNLSRGLR
ncbi:hypothetical protein WJX64_16790 [Leifsonia sp. YIM 134122]|uniref:LysM domain-containing protein n=1 Tax=Leifsonia stereocauli TaxID=3134136 RepID=A0ABU9W898_9MICO